MAKETPDEFWERMRSEGRSGARVPERPPDIAAQPPQPAEPPRAEQTVRPARNAGWDDPAPPEREYSNGRTEPDSGESSTAELVKQLTEQTKTLVKQEMRLAQVELQEKGKKVGIGAGMFGAGGVVAFFGAAALIAAVVLGLSTALATWLSALIVGVVLLAIAGAAALGGKKKIEQATPPVPEQTVETVKEDVEHVKARAKR